MTKQEQKVSDHYRDAIIALSVEIDRYKNSSGFAPMLPPLYKARDALHELYGDWLSRVKTPADITPAIKAQWLRQLANEIEESNES